MIVIPKASGESTLLRRLISLDTTFRMPPPMFASLSSKATEICLLATNWRCLAGPKLRFVSLQQLFTAPAANHRPGAAGLPASPRRVKPICRTGRRNGAPGSRNRSARSRRRDGLRNHLYHCP